MARVCRVLDASRRFLLAVPTIALLLALAGPVNALAQLNGEVPGPVEAAPSETPPPPEGLPPTDAFPSTEGMPCIEGSPYSESMPCIEGVPGIEGMPYCEGMPSVEGMPYVDGAACGQNLPYVVEGEVCGTCMAPDCENECRSSYCCLDECDEDLGEYFTLNDTNVAFVDSAVVASQFRLRYDDANGFNAYDRAEYFATTLDTFGGKAPVTAVGLNNNLDLQALRIYTEVAPNDFASVFVELNLLWTDPSGFPGGPGGIPTGQNQFGFGDMIAGVKYALWQNEHNLLTFQFKNHIPTGEAVKQMSTGHYSAEPGFLYMHRFSSRWRFEAEARDWIPVYASINPLNGNHAAGNVFIYGFGTSYDLIDRDDVTVSPVLEFTGWKVDSGQKTVITNNVGPLFEQQTANGDGVFNVNIGARLTCKKDVSLYLGYGNCLTSERWYNDILRFEYRLMY